MKFKIHAPRIAAALCFAVFAAWALLAAIVIRNHGDTLIGFHPVILSTVPGMVAGAFSAVILLVFRQGWTGLALGAGVLTLFLVLRNGHAIQEQAWQHTIVLHARSNAQAVDAIQADLDKEGLSMLWNEKKLSPVKDFHWYGKNHIAAPDGVYYGFRVGGAPHVRIQKIRNGWRGIALVPTDSTLATLATRTGMSYTRVGSSGWVTWSTEP